MLWHIVSQHQNRKPLPARQIAITAHKTRHRDPRFRSNTSAYRNSTPLETVPETTAPAITSSISATTAPVTTSTMASTAVSWSTTVGGNQQEQYASVTSSEIPCCDGHTSYSQLTPAWSSPLPAKPEDSISKGPLLSTERSTFALNKPS